MAYTCMHVAGVYIMSASGLTRYPVCHWTNPRWWLMLAVGKSDHFEVLGGTYQLINCSFPLVGGLLLKYDLWNHTFDLLGVEKNPNESMKKRLWNYYLDVLLLKEAVGTLHAQFYSLFHLFFEDHSCLIERNNWSESPFTVGPHSYRPHFE